MRQINKLAPFFLYILMITISSCTRGEEGFTPGIIAIFITGAFVVGVIIFFLVRPQHKRKGDKNRKP